MYGLHRLLHRQVRKHLGGLDRASPEVLALIQEVDEAYRGNDTDRGMLERSLDLSSQELFEANSELRAIFGALPDTIFRIDAHGTILDVKAGAADDLVLVRSCLVGRRFQDAPFLSGSSDIAELIEEAMATRAPTRGMYTLDVAGEPNHYELRLLPFLDHQLIGIVGNVTELRRAEAELREANDHLRREMSERRRAEEERRVAEDRAARSEKLESLGVLAGGIAHEINTPTQYVGDNTRFFQQSFEDLVTLIDRLQAVLAAAKGGAVPAVVVEEAERAIKSADLEYLLGETPKAIEEALEGVSRVTKIVQAMKTFAHVSMELTPTDLAAAIRSTVTVASNEWKYVADMTLDFDEDLPQVDCVPDRFNQVILNLVVNAAHAIEEAREPGKYEKGRVAIRTRRAGEFAEVSVEDTGVGMSEEIQAKIFDPFFTTKALGKGTGQGLSVVHAVIVKEHGGSISVESAPGAGSVFVLRLPLVASSSGSGVTD